MDARARRRLAQAPCTDARMLQLVAAPGRRAIASDDRATRCYVADQEDMGGAIAKIAGRPWGGRRRGGKGMACDVGVTRGENGRSRSRTRFVATLVRGAC